MLKKDCPLKILIVDDDKFILDMYSMKFKKSGLQITAMAGCLETLEKLRFGEVFDIVLLDIIMPKMDGLELLKMIRAEKLIPDATIIMLTNQVDDFEKTKVFGVDGYIIKATTIPSEVVDQVLLIYNNKHKNNDV